jgi:hypothetical protein
MLRTPRIVLDALQPLSVTVAGRLMLRPVTFGHAALLDRLQTDEAPALSVARSLLILTRPAAESVALLERGLPVFDKAATDLLGTVACVENLPGLIQAHIAAPFEANKQRRMPEARETSGGEEALGLGWLLAEASRAVDMGVPADRLQDFPIATCFALGVADDIRNGAEWKSPSYIREDQFEQAGRTAAVPAAASGTGVPPVGSGVGTAGSAVRAGEESQ